MHKYSKYHHKGERRSKKYYVHMTPYMKCRLGESLCKGKYWFFNKKKRKTGEINSKLQMVTLECIDVSCAKKMSWILFWQEEPGTYSYLGIKYITNVTGNINEMSPLSTHSITYTSECGFLYKERTACTI